MFQSPSLRGSGRFMRISPDTGDIRIGSQSPSLRGSGRFRVSTKSTKKKEEVSIPFIAGQWSLRGRPPATKVAGGVSIPFIAGQWSLHGGEGEDGPRLHVFQSPSLRGSGRFVRAARPTSEEARKGFNPLHCGAVVASRCGHCRRSHCCFVSIPFIAGQWSLPSPETSWIYFLEVFQSPSLRGSGRFLATLQIPGVRCCRFQSPSLRGSGRFINDIVGLASPPLVSIPFIAGQWSLRTFFSF